MFNCLQALKLPQNSTIYNINHKLAVQYEEEEEDKALELHNFFLPGMYQDFKTSLLSNKLRDK
jgi:hypothetical protein